MSNRILHVLYPAGPTGLTPTAILQALHAHENHQAALTEHLNTLERAGRIIRKTNRYAHPAYPHETRSVDGTITMSTTSAAIIAAVAERLDREYHTISSSGYGTHGGLTFRLGTRKPLQPHPRAGLHALLESIIEQLSISNQTLEQLHANLNTENEPTLEITREALEVLQRVGVTTTSSQEDTVIHHLAWVHPKLTLSSPEVKQAGEDEPVVGATMLHYYVSAPADDPDTPNMSEFTIPELSINTAFTLTNEADYYALASLYASALARQGHLRLSGDTRNNHPVFTIHPGLVRTLRQAPHNPVPAPIGYSPSVREQTLQALQQYALPAPLNLEGYTAVDALVTHLNEPQPLTSIRGVLQAHASEEAALSVITEALERTSTKPTRLTAREAGLTGAAKKAHIQRELRKLLNSPPLLPQDVLAERFHVSQGTISRYLQELRGESQPPTAP